jgi:hypothetical protein
MENKVMNLLGNLINGETLIPDLLLSAPHVRPVLDRYGLQGCGGELGPMETLAFFAKAHDVPLDNLLQEIRSVLNGEQSSATPSATPSVPLVQIQSLPVVEEKENSQFTSELADTIYRPFFKSGIAIVLTLGAVWGAYLLLRIGFLGSFNAVGLHEVNAHGHAQIFGWVGLFVMGFAYQAFPRFKHTRLAYPQAAYATLIMMLIGIVFRAVCEPLGVLYSPAWGIAIAASMLEVVAIVLFVWIIGTTLYRSGKPLAFYDYYILCSLFWFIVQAVYETLLLNAYTGAPDRETLLNLIATWQAPLREIQIHGFALLIILGVSQRIFHHFYDLPAPNRRKSLISLFALNAAVIGEITGLILMRTSSHAWAGLWYSSILVMIATIAVLVWDWKIFRPSRDWDRNLKFMRAAYIWLFISLTMMVLLPLYQFVLLPGFAPESAAVQMGFSHAYYGAIRHAITVGFISLMIVGVAAKVVPTLNGVDLHALTALWAPFILINLGCAIRVFGQTLTDFSEIYFPIAGISGLLEVTGLSIWGVHLFAVMAGKARLYESNRAPASYTPLVENGVIVETNVVGEVLDRYPTLLDAFLAYGFEPLKNPLLRKTLARRVTIQKAAQMVGVDAQAFVRDLNMRAQEYQRHSVINMTQVTL